MSELIDIILNLDDHLRQMIVQYGLWIYVILFTIVFAETGLVVCPFLPGDSLLFAAGVISANKDAASMNVGVLWLIFISGAFLGDNVNYQIGRVFGTKLFKHESSKFFKPSYLEKTKQFMEKHGKMAILIARFVPLMRTFVPFTCGLSRMNFPQYLMFSLSSAVIWVSICLFGGFFFGQVPIVKENFEIAIFSIIGFTILPIIIHLIIARVKARKARANPTTESTD